MEVVTNFESTTTAAVVMQGNVTFDMKRLAELIEIDPMNYLREIVHVIYMVIFVIGLIGNGTVIYVLAIMCKKHSVTDVYVLNLAIADVLLLSCLPFYADEFHNESWNFGIFMCKAVSALTYLSMHASIFFLAALSVDRRFAIVKAVKSRRVRDIRYAWTICSVVWLLASASVILPLMFREVNDQKTCAWSNYVPYNMWFCFRVFGGFVLPYSILVWCYVDILRFMTKRDMKKSRTNKSSETNRVMKMVLIITVCFVVCWLPNQVLTMYKMIADNSWDDYLAHEIQIEDMFKETVKGVFVINKGVVKQYVDDASAHYRDFNIHLFSVILGFANSMMNPIVYSFIGQTFRQNAIAMIKCHRTAHTSGIGENTTMGSVRTKFRSVTKVWHNVSRRKLTIRKKEQQLTSDKDFQCFDSPKTTITAASSPQTCNNHQKCSIDVQSEHMSE